MNTKPIPVIITLAAAFISCVVSIVQRVEFAKFVSRLLIVVVIFLVMGTIIKMILDYSFRTLEPTVSLDDQIDASIEGDLSDEQTQEDETSIEESTGSEEG